VAPVLKELILFYKDRREPGEPFYRFVRRVGIETLQKRFDEIRAQVAAR
jgi:ferredoxin-nitrite reductase